MQWTHSKYIFKYFVRFFLGLSWVFFVTNAFTIAPIAPNAIQYIKTIFLTRDGSNTSATGIILEWLSGDGRFRNSVTVNNLPDAIVVGTNASGKLIYSTSGAVYNYISGFITSGPQWIQGNTWATWAIPAHEWSWTTWLRFQLPNGAREPSFINLLWPIGNTWAMWASWYAVVINIVQTWSESTNGQCASTGNIIGFYADKNYDLVYTPGTDTLLWSTIMCSDGATWPQWPIGNTWPTWSQWPQWPIGNTWATWIQWIQWIQWNIWATWAKWATWSTWVQWIQGIQWLQWIQGIQWNTWATWSQWIQWIQWNTWSTWATWAQWIQGIQWTAGTNGTNWSQWIQWIQGNIWATGPSTDRYLTGVNYNSWNGLLTLYVSWANAVTWTIDLFGLWNLSWNYIYNTLWSTRFVGIGTNFLPKAKLQVVGNFIAGDYSNTITWNSLQCSIVWWSWNTISNNSNYSTIAWWSGNNISWANYSRVWGWNAQAYHTNSFVWNASDTPFTTTKEKTFIINAPNGIGINTANPATGTLHVGGTGIVVFEPQNIKWWNGLYWVSSNWAPCTTTGAVYFMNPTPITYNDLQGTDYTWNFWWFLCECTRLISKWSSIATTFQNFIWTNDTQLQWRMIDGTTTNSSGQVYDICEPNALLQSESFQNWVKYHESVWAA